jgi:aminoglycoside 6-adenylyltransferase
MRTEREMLDLILATARADERIRAVILNGSRVNPEVERDPFQDFDVVYLVTDVASFRRDPGWIDRFGERMILQTPDEMGESPRPDGAYAYLMQLADGNRIDLTLYPIDHRNAMAPDSLSVLLLDKDGRVPPFPPPNPSSYAPRPPTAKQYADCCNEFWWCAPYVAKGLWRRQLPYARYMLDTVLRDQTRKMLEWYIGTRNGFTSGAGYLGKYLEKRLEPELWAAWLKTYADPGTDASWDALQTMGGLFRTVAQRVAANFGFAYPQDEDERVSAHLHHVRRLPADAGEIY